jgi:MFS family permease
MSVVTAGAPSSLRGIAVVVFVGSFLDSLGYGVTFLLPPLFAGLGGDAADVGAVLGVAAVTTLISVAFAGHISDGLGRPKATALASLCLAAAHLGFSQAGSMSPLLFICGALLGVGWGLFYCLSAIILAVLIPPAERPKLFLLQSACIMAGIGLGPLIGPFLAIQGSDVSAAFLAVAVATAIGALLFAAVSVPVRRQESINGVDGIARLDGPSVRRVLASEARYPIAMVGIGACVFAGFHAYQTVIADRLGLPFSVFFTVYTLTVVSLRVVLAGVMGRAPLYLASGFLLVAMSVGSALFLVATGSLLLYGASAVLLGIGYGITYALIKSIVANESPPGLAPQAMQLFNLSYFVGVFGFPFVGGFVIVHFGTAVLIVTMIALAVLECVIAFQRHWANRCRAQADSA